MEIVHKIDQSVKYTNKIKLDFYYLRIFFVIYWYFLGISCVSKNNICSFTNVCTLIIVLKTKIKDGNNTIVSIKYISENASRKFWTFFRCKNVIKTFTRTDKENLQGLPIKC